MAPPDEEFLLATLPPSRRQVRLAAGCAVALIVAFAATVPFRATPLPRSDAFIPVVETAIIINDLITATLLYAQFFIVRRWALLVLANGYLFTALIVIPHMLTYPGVFAPEGLLAGGLQTSAWIYAFWHIGLMLSVIIYAALKDTAGQAGISRQSPATSIGISVAAVIALVCALTWFALDTFGLLPDMYVDDIHRSNSPFGSVITMLPLGTLALLMLWLRRRSVLDLWLMVVCCAWIIEIAMNTVWGSDRFAVSWYMSRVYALVAALFILLVLLSETTALYANLASSIIRQRGNREARQIAMDAMAAAIAHELNQPLAAVSINANTGLRWLASDAPDLDEVKSALNGVVRAGQRAIEVIASVRAMFRPEIRGRTKISINDLIREVITMVDVDLRAQRVAVSTELPDGLSQLLADRGQLQQVLLNLITNAIQAMRPVNDRPRVLSVRSRPLSDSPGVQVAVEDSGVGIEAKDKDRIFEPFFTTKATGTGIGLAICRSIVESHGGALRVSSKPSGGTIFQIDLPDIDR
jgi:signal transduction histidine kinase